MKLHFDWFIGDGCFPLCSAACAQAYEDDNTDANLRDGEYVRLAGSTYEDTVDHGTVCHECGKRASALQALHAPTRIKGTIAQHPVSGSYSRYFSPLTVSK